MTKSRRQAEAVFADLTRSTTFATTNNSALRTASDGSDAFGCTTPLLCALLVCLAPLPHTDFVGRRASLRRAHLARVAARSLAEFSSSRTVEYAARLALLRCWVEAPLRVTTLVAGNAAGDALSQRGTLEECAAILVNWAALSDAERPTRTEAGALPWTTGWSSAARPATFQPAGFSVRIAVPHAAFETANRLGEAA